MRFTKKRCSAKKAAIQIDWIISFSVFIVYLVWFFAFVVPSFEPRKDISPLMYPITSNLDKNVSWTVEKIPLIIKSNITAGSEPVICDFYPGANSSNYAFADNSTFSSYDNKVLFLSNLSRGTLIKTVVHSNETYNETYQWNDLYATSTQSTVATKGFTAEFSSGMLNKISYKTGYQVNSTNFYINGNLIPALTSIFNGTSSAAMYKAQSQALNQTFFVLGKNSRIYAYMQPNYGFTGSNITVSMLLSEYNTYFSNNLYQGTINSASATCVNYTSDKVTMTYNQNNSLTVFFSSNSKIRICNDNSTIILNMTMALSNETSYRIFLHDGNQTEVVNYTVPYSCSVGAAEKITGVKTSLLTQLSTQNYATIKTAWSFPTNKEFLITITNSTDNTILSYGKIANTSTTINVKEYYCNIVDSHAALQRCKINIRVW